MALINNDRRLLAFEYVLKQLLSWQANSGCYDTNSNDISTLKAVKLLFFISAVNSSKSGDNFLLLDVFKNFVAMPYGHVESVIYDEIRNRKGVLNFYAINNNGTSKIEGKDDSELDRIVELQIRRAVDLSITKLISINNGLICMSAFELVDLSHAWYSWRKTYSVAKEEGLGSKPIDVNDVIAEDKIFRLQAF